MNDPALDALIKKIEETDKIINSIPCLLCGKPSDQTLTIITEDPLLGAPEPGSRTMLFGICNNDWKTNQHLIQPRAQQIIFAEDSAHLLKDTLIQ